MKLRARASMALLTVLVFAPIAVLTAAQPAAAAGTPTLTSVTPDNAYYEGGQTVTITGTNLTGATAVRFWFFSAPSFTVVNDTTITAVVPSSMGTGSHPLTVTTPAGTSNDLTFTFTNTPPPPVLHSITPATGSTNGGDSIDVLGDWINVGSTLTMDGVTVNPYQGNGPGELKYFTPPHAAGAVDVVITTDGGSFTMPYGFTYGSAPFVIGITPPHSTPAGGDSVTITGRNFTGATEVDFGSTPASNVSVVSDTSITATVPAHAAGIVDVTVVSPGGTSTVRSGDEFAYGGQPTVTAVSPSVGPSAGGTAVTITGSEFTSDASVAFGSASGSSVTVVSPSEITVVAPPASAGTVDVTVSTPFGTSTTTSADQYTYGNLPAIAYVAPAQGLTSGGTSVTVVGTSFTGATAVHFGADAATNVVVVSDSQITATAPAGSAGTVDVTVTVTVGTSTTTSADRFTYVDASPPLPASVCCHMAAADGGVFAVDGASYAGSMGGKPLSHPIVGIAASADGTSYWLVASDGGVFTFGDAGFFGSTAGRDLPAPIVGIAATADGHGYYLAGADGAVYAFGDATDHGSMAGQHLNAPVVGITATAHGYFLVAADGGVFAFGDAQFAGSLAAATVNAPIVGMTATGHGYLLAGADGGVFSFGGATMLGSMAGRGMTAPVVGIIDTTDGYVLASADGDDYAFGVHADGLVTTTKVVAPVVGIA